MKTAAPIELPIFRSDGQARLLARLYLHEHALSLTALQNGVGLSAGAVHREVERLERAGLLRTQRVGRTRLVSPNHASPFYLELRGLLTKAFGPVPLLRRALGDLNGIESVLIYGSWAARALGVDDRTPQDIDVLVVGEPELDGVYAACRSVEDQVGLPVNPTVVTRAEWDSDRSGFAASVRGGSQVPVIGGVDGS